MVYYVVIRVWIIIFNNNDNNGTETFNDNVVCNCLFYVTQPRQKYLHYYISLTINLVNANFNTKLQK